MTMWRDAWLMAAWPRTSRTLTGQVGAGLSAGPPCSVLRWVALLAIAAMAFLTTACGDLAADLEAELADAVEAAEEAVDDGADDDNADDNAVDTADDDLDGSNAESVDDGDTNHADSPGDAGSADEPTTSNDNPEPLSTSNVAIERVVDGDSLEVVLQPAGTEVEVRLVGYNAPELFSNDTRTCNGEQARLVLESKLAEAPNLTLLDFGTDRFGRLLGDFELPTEGGSSTLVAALVTDGVGLATGDSLTNRQLMVEAADANRGIWGDQCGQATTGALIIAETQVNPDGNDRFNLVEEWVRIENTSDADVVLDGWILRDDTTGHRFPLSGVLGPGRSLTVRSGDGSSDSQNLYLDESFPVWSNEWETVILVDPQGVLSHWTFVG